MKTEKIRCWKVGSNKELFITYPEGSVGHRLICCDSCGNIYAVNVAKQLYIEPNLEKHLSGTRCLQCQSCLRENWSFYPDNYVDELGILRTYIRSRQLPEKADSIIIELPEVFS